MSDRVRRRFIVRGHVQGVFFRDSIRQRAQAESVSGWARNLYDGSVETVLEGAPAAVEHVAAFLRTGPRRARVEDVEVHDEPPEGVSGFRIR